MRLPSIAWIAIYLAALAPLLAPAAPGPSRAGTALRMDVDQLVDGSHWVARGEVLGARTLEEGGRIDTEYLLTVDHTYWGEASGSRTVRLPGGVLPDGRGMIIPGLPHPKVGDEVLLFLGEPAEDGMQMVVGLDQGWYRLVTTAAGERLAVRGAGGGCFVNPTTGSIGHGFGWDVRPYAELAAELERACAARAALPQEER